MGMGGFVLQSDGCQVFPIILNTKFKDQSGNEIKIEKCHFVFENLYENIKVGEILKCGPSFGESRLVKKISSSHI
jgi:hypothetical protein